MRNIDYSIKLISNFLFIEAKLSGAMNGKAWADFMSLITESSGTHKSIYLLIDENGKSSDIDFATVQGLIKKTLEQHFDEVILSFVTTDPLKTTLERLFSDMASIAKVPLKVTYHKTIKDAETLIRNFCFKCKSTMFPAA
mgnify:CR=1 FL=1